MALFGKKPAQPKLPPSVKCMVCSAAKEVGQPETRWAKAHCTHGCAWYVCDECHGTTWISYSAELESWVVRRAVRVK